MIQNPTDDVSTMVRVTASRTKDLSISYVGLKGTAHLKQHSY